MKRKLQPAPGSSSAVEISLGIEDVCGEALLQLLSRLRELKANPRQRPIENSLGYAAIVAYNACNEHIRQMYPERYRLRNRVRFLLTHDQTFSLWESHNESVCGFARWQNDDHHEGARRLRDLQDSASAFAESGLSSTDLERLDLDGLLRAVFEVGSAVPSSWTHWSTR